MADRTSQEIYLEIKSLFEEFDKEHNSDSKVSQRRARKAIGEIKKLVTEYRKASVEEHK